MAVLKNNPPRKPTVASEPYRIYFSIILKVRASCRGKAYHQHTVKTTGSRLEITRHRTSGYCKGEYGQVLQGNCVFFLQPFEGISLHRTVQRWGGTSYASQHDRHWCERFRVWHALIDLMVYASSVTAYAERFPLRCCPGH